MDFAIIGAGIAGLSCADGLVAAGHGVTLFDKGRGPGGRMSTRRVDLAEGPTSFDHGAQYFTVRDPGFAAIVARWQAEGHVARWPALGADAWVGTPGMNAPIRAMAARHRVEWRCRVTGIARTPAGWSVAHEGGVAGGFDAVIVAVPCDQAAPLLSLHHFDFARRAMAARSQPCWAAMLRFPAPIAGAPDVVRECGPIVWACRDSAKPGHGGGDAGHENWVIHARADWSARHLEAEADWVAHALAQALGEALGQSLPAPELAIGHRWRFAMAQGSGDHALWDATMRLGACGDWLIGPRVELAWCSGRDLARRVAGLSGETQHRRRQAQAG